MHAFENNGTIRDFLTAAGLLLNLCDLYRSLPVVILNRSFTQGLQGIIFYATLVSAPGLTRYMLSDGDDLITFMNREGNVFLEMMNVISLLACTIYRVTAFKGLFEDNSSTNNIFIVIAFVQLFILDGLSTMKPSTEITLFAKYSKKRMYSVLSFDHSDENRKHSNLLDNSNDEAAVVLDFFFKKCDFDSNGDLDFFEFVAFINLLKLKGANTDNLPTAWNAYNNVYMATQLFDIYQYIRMRKNETGNYYRPRRIFNCLTEKSKNPLLFFCTLGANTDEIRSKLVEIGIIGS